MFKKNSSFVFRPFNPKVVDIEQAKDYLGQLRTAIGKILRHEGSSLGFTALYECVVCFLPHYPVFHNTRSAHSHIFLFTQICISLAYKMTLYKHSEMLYEGVVETVRSHLEARAEELRDVANESLLSRLKELWDSHLREMRMVRDILMYMDNRCMSQQPRKSTIWDMSLGLFRDTVLRHVGVRKRVTDLLLAAFGEARLGQSCIAMDTGLLASVVLMLVDLGVGTLGVYVEEFETPFLEEAATLAASRSAEFFPANSVPEYIAWVERTLECERGCVTRAAHPSTLPKLSAVLERVLVGEAAASLVNAEGSGLWGLLERGDAASLRTLARMHALFSLYREPLPWTDFSGKVRSLPPLGIMRESFKGYIESTGGRLLWGGGDPLG